MPNFCGFFFAIVRIARFSRRLHESGRVYPIMFYFSHIESPAWKIRTKLTFRRKNNTPTPPPSLWSVEIRKRRCVFVHVLASQGRSRRRPLVGAQWPRAIRFVLIRAFPIEPFRRMYNSTLNNE